MSNQSAHRFRSLPMPLAIRPIARIMDRLNFGELEIAYKQSSWFFRGVSPNHLSSDMEIFNPLGLLWKGLTRGDIGFAESFMAGDWGSSDLPDLLELFAANEKYLNRRYRNSSWRNLFTHRFNMNSSRGSRCNIAYHYDLGNAFYDLWLDRTMSYSAASFDDPLASLERAQQRKYEQLLDRLEASPEQDLLEIGCGWGGLAEVAAKRGHRIDGITLSREQLGYARNRLSEQGLSDLARFDYLDYRSISRQYDHIVSIEMFEAVGERYWPAFFDVINKALRPGGRAALQLITIDESYFESYRDNADFIQLYVFPGGMLPSLTRFREHAIRAGFRLLDSSLNASDYTRTLQLWSERFETVYDEIRELGFDERFIRMWRYYLAYCEAGFKAGRVDLARITLEKIA